MEFVRFDCKSDGLQHLTTLFSENRRCDIPIEDWFRYRYFQNPYGEAVIVCGMENGVVEACVVIEQVLLMCYGRVRRCGIVSVLCSNKESVSQDAANGLLDLAERAAMNEGVEIVFAFGELAEQVGNNRDGWCRRKVDFLYRFVQTEPFHSLFCLSDLEKAFEPELFVYSRIFENEYGLLTDLAGMGCGPIALVMSDEFLRWYGCTHSNEAVAKVSTGNIGIMGYAGRRSGIKEFHLLGMYPMAGDCSPLHYQERVVESITASVHPDIISFAEEACLLDEEQTDYISNHLDFVYRVLAGDGEDVDEMAETLYRWMKVW